jgi:hypothetical protein
MAAGLGVGSVFPQAEPSWNGCACDSSEDPQLVGNLLEQLSSSTEKFISCRQQLLRQKYHVPIIIGNPFAVLLGDSNIFLWQCLSGVLAVLCAALLVHTRRSKAAYTSLQQHAKGREAEWQRAITSLHATLQDRMQLREQVWQQKQSEWQEKEAAWQQGVQEVTQLVQLREAALSDQSPAMQLPSKVRSGVCLLTDTVMPTLVGLSLFCAHTIWYIGALASFWSTARFAAHCINHRTPPPSCCPLMARLRGCVSSLEHMRFAPKVCLCLRASCPSSCEGSSDGGRLGQRPRVHPDLTLLLLLMVLHCRLCQLHVARTLHLMRQHPSA